MATYAERKAARQRELERALERFVQVCRDRPDVRAVFLFGSLAEWRVGPRSDLDILVVRETAVRGIERGSDLAIAADVGVPLDLIVVTPDEFREGLPATSFGRTLLATARSVYAA
ncbi:MAG: nucleotidyltransferase domain-containing protein [Candidatus Eremiobacteraeota bacterium]|nr:nucleotidyltransferase domain-containing protein [Candidatus Eremiobacteraeota bacterium]